MRQPRLPPNLLGTLLRKYCQRQQHQNLQLHRQVLRRRLPLWGTEEVKVRNQHLRLLCPRLLLRQQHQRLLRHPLRRQRQRQRQRRIFQGYLQPPGRP